MLELYSEASEGRQSQIKWNYIAKSVFKRIPVGKRERGQPHVEIVRLL